MNIKYFGIGRKDGEIILKCTPEKSMKSEISKEAAKIFKQMKDLNLVSEERQKISTKKGNWFTKCDDNNLIYFALVDREYPERHAYGLSQILQNTVSKLQSPSSQTDSQLKSHLKPVMKDNVGKYQDLKAIDKIAQANATVEEVRIQMEINLKKTMDNQPNLDVKPSN